MLKHIYQQIKYKKLVGIFIVLGFAFLCFTRLYQLGEKPYHHDESLYAKYSYDYAQQGVYDFNPILHGPMLFTVQALCFKLFGDSDFTGRLSSALSGILMIYLACWLIYLVYSRLEPVLSLLILTTLSPSITYFSRFLGMDALLSMLFIAALLSLYQFLKSQKTRYLLIASLLASFMVCTKLNYLFYFFYCVAFCLTLYSFKRNAFWRVYNALKNALNQYFYIKIFAFVLTPVVVFTLLYSGFGQNWPGVLDGLYRKMIPYWINQNKIQRIGGPFDYYLHFLIQYELPLVLGILSCFIHTVVSSSKNIRSLGIIAVVSLLAYAAIKYFWQSTFSNVLGILHIDQPYHFLILVFYIYAGVIMTLNHLRRDQLFSAFIIFWFWVSLSLYSYAGEKVPWLLVHIVFPAFIYLAFQLSDIVQRSLHQVRKKRILGLFLVTLISWQMLNVYRSSFLFSAHPKNRLAYTHTSWETKVMAEKILACKKAMPKLKVETLRDAMTVWPLSWYLRHYQGWFTVNQNPSFNSAIFIQDWHRKGDITTPVLDQYADYRYKLREWLVLEQTLVNFKYYLNYSLYWESPENYGSADSIAYVHPSALNCWINYESKP